MKAKSFTLDKPKRSEGWAKFQEWNRKWNRILATIFCILCFVLLFAIVIVNIMETKEIQMEKSTTIIIQLLNEVEETTQTPPTLHNQDNGDSSNARSLSVAQNAVEKCTISKCQVYCSSGILESLNSDIELALLSENENYCNEINLTLSNYNYDNVLYTNWYSLNYPVRALEISNSAFQTIEDYAFNTNQFKMTTYLKLFQLKSMKNITKNVFVGMSSVSMIMFENFGLKVVIDNGILAPMCQKLTTLSVHRLPFDVPLDSITGSVQLSSVTVADLSSNNIGDLLTNNTLSGLINVRSLYLHVSGITSLPNRIFDHLISVEQIYLKSNQIHIVPSGIFDKITRTLKNLFLAENNLDCSCTTDVLNFQKYMIDHETIIWDDIICQSPLVVQGQLLKTVEIYCATEKPETTRNLDTTTLDYNSRLTDKEPVTSALTSQETSTAPNSHLTQTDKITEGMTEIETTTEYTTELIIQSTTSVNDVYQNCVNHVNMPSANYADPIIIEAYSSKFKILKDANDDIFIEFNTYVINMTLLWFSNETNIENSIEQLQDYDTKVQYNCAKNAQKRIKIDNLRENTVYIFCYVDHSDGRVVPFSCAALRLTCDLSFDNDLIGSCDSNTWITKSSKAMVIAIFSASLLMAILCGSFIMYCCLKRFPFFIQTQESRKFSRPWQHEEPEYHTSANYITPTPARKPSKKDRRSTLNTRRFSETSAGSARSYVSAVTPSPFDIISFRMNNKQKFRLNSNKPEATYDEARENILYLEKLPDLPPPLPPHPNRRSNQSNLSSNQSTNSTSSSDPLFSISYCVQHDSDRSHTNSYA